MKHNLATDDISTLLKRFAIPAVIANIVNALYNISDQIFIGWGVGYLGNAATNIAFPITTVSLSLSLLFGVGGGTLFNLQMGSGQKTEAKKTVGSTFSTLFILGLVLMVLVKGFLKPLMVAFGATDQLLSYAMTYSSITSWSLPFFMLSSGGSPLIRSDGSPQFSMTSVITGAVLNTILNPIFIFVFQMGIAGAAWATVISQIVSGLFVSSYLLRFKQVAIEKKDFKVSMDVLRQTSVLGMTAMFNQISATIVQIMSNNLLRTYGALSDYGVEIPIAIAGIVAKVNMIFTSVIIGLTQGSQPIVGFNYGAKQFNRVKETYFLLVKASLVISLVAMLVFEVFAPQIIGLFGSGNALYMTYGVKYLRIFMLMLMLNGVQMSSTTFYTAIGKGQIGAFLALTKQVFILVPSLMIFVMTFGVGNIMWAAPVSDVLAFIITTFFITKRMKKLTTQAEQQNMTA